MEGPIKERDWKYLRRIQDEMLHDLCSRINLKAAEITTAKDKNPHERYLKLYRHIEESDSIVASCFNDWRRSNISIKIISLRRYGLLQDSHIENFSDSAKEWLSKVEEMDKM